MFTIQPKPTFKLDVTIPTVTGPGKITFVFKHKGRKAIAEFIESLTKEGDGVKDVDALLDIIEDWEKVDAKFSADALEQLLENYPGAGKAIFDAYLPAVLEGRLAEKNSVK